MDIENRAELVHYLRREKLIPPGADPEVLVLAGGVSNRTVLVACEGAAPFVVKQALPKLRVETDWFSDPVRIHREARGLEWLVRFAPPGAIPPLLFEDQRHHLIGMAAVPEPHYNWKHALLAGEIEFDHVRQFAELLGVIHRQSTLDASVPEVFRDRSFFETLRVEPYYRYSAEQIPKSRSFFDHLIAETFEARLALVHGDYSPKNILVHEGRLVLLDHEVIHFGDPAFDVGFSLTHLLSKAHHVEQHRRKFVQATQLYANCYFEELQGLGWRAGVEQRAVRHTIACLLARVAGRSPLEYLTQSERARQREIALKLMLKSPARIPELIDRFAEEIACPS
jgi:aminoglycoside phosphotransferase (APT) family kinase protein